MSSRLFPYNRRVTDNPATTLRGAFQNRTYTPSLIKKIGCWTGGGVNIDSGVGQLTNKYINPFMSKLLQTYPLPFAGWYNKYTSGGGAVEPYVWNPNAPTYTKNSVTYPRPEYQCSQYSNSQPQWENWRWVLENWQQFFDLHYPVLVEWLAPGWLKGLESVDGPYPFISFQFPHGKIGEHWTIGNDFYASCTAREYGFDYLVDWFYERTRFYHALGVTTGIATGHPTQNNTHQLREHSAYLDVMEQIKYGHVRPQLDAATEKPFSGFDGDCARELVANGDGCGFEGFFPPGVGDGPSWLDPAYNLDFEVAVDDAFDRVHPDYQKSWATIQGYPVLNNAGFASYYGANRYIYWVCKIDWYRDDLISYPGFTGTDNQIDTYLAAYAVKTKRLLTVWPKSVLLLPIEVCYLAASRRFRAAEFMP